MYVHVRKHVCACCVWVCMCVSVCMILNIYMYFICFSLLPSSLLSRIRMIVWRQWRYLRLLLIWHCSWSNYGWSGWVGLTFSADEHPYCSVSLARLIAVAQLLRKLKSKLVVFVVMYLCLVLTWKSLAFKIFWSCKFLWWLHGLHETRKELLFSLRKTFFWVVCVAGAIIPHKVLIKDS